MYLKIKENDNQVTEDIANLYFRLIHHERVGKVLDSNNINLCIDRKPMNQILAAIW